MTSSVDGRVRTRRWSPLPRENSAGEAYERIHDRLAGDAWICGRVTMNGYATGAPPPPYDGPAIAREDHVAKEGAKGYAVGLDARGRMHWGARNDITGDHVVVVLGEDVPDAHLAALRGAGISYFFAGRAGLLDVGVILSKLDALFGVRRLLVEGGGGINGSFLRAGAVDEISLLLAPAVDGLRGAPAVFDYDGAADDPTPKGLALSLLSCETLADGVVWLRYGVRAADPRGG